MAKTIMDVFDHVASLKFHILGYERAGKTHDMFRFYVWGTDFLGKLIPMIGEWALSLLLNFVCETACS